VSGCLNFLSSDKYWSLNKFKKNFTASLSDFNVSVGTSAGKVRKSNQDRVLAAHYRMGESLKGSLFIVVLCDGVGGMDDGDLCAEVASYEFIQSVIFSDASLSIEARIESAVNRANDEVYRKYGGSGGATLSAIVVDPMGVCYGVNVGDSRIYSVTSRFELHQVSTDDTIGGVVARVKGEDASKYDGGEYSKQLAQFIGLGDSLSIDLIRLDSGQGYLLTSDGAHDLPGGIFERIVIGFEGAGAQESVKRLLQLSNWLGGYDNATVAYLPDINSVIGELRKHASDTHELKIWNGTSDANFIFVDKPILNIKEPVKTEPLSKGQLTLTPDSPEWPAKKTRRKKRTSQKQPAKDHVGKMKVTIIPDERD